MATETPSPGQETAVLTLDEAQREYVKAAGSLPLPAGESYPDSIRLSEAAPGSAFEVGVGTNDAFRYYWCEWEYEYLDAFGKDQKRTDVAVEKIRRISEHPIFKSGWDQASVVPLFRDITEAAQLGDPSGVQGEVDANCRARRYGQH